MPTNKFTIASQALVLIGHPPIASFEGPSSGAIAANALYEDTVLEVLSLHRWTFAKRAVALSRLADAPATEWEAAYEIPGTANIIYAVQVRGEDIVFDRFADEIHCNALATDTVVLIEGFRADETRWPPYFDSLMRVKLASVFAIPVAESQEKASIYEGKLIRALTNAKTQDSQGRTAAKMPVGALRRYHQGRP